MPDAAPRTLLTLEDYAPGQEYRTAEITVSAEEIIAFARAFDPQPFHLGAEQAAGSFFGGLVASGWHTAALTMRLMASHHTVPAWGVIGRGVDGLTWSQPVRPGDRLSVVMTVLAVTPSRSKPWLGTVRLRCQTVARPEKPMDGEISGPSPGVVVQEMTPSIVVPTRDGVHRHRPV